ncbi:TonB-dependent receptor domain-containing protein [Brevundimonas sp. DWR2-3-1b1]|uniref:TonB-dependent receptor domain-containing protein n=1 Tax=unclassified Brevundimonas TaxID=2622653 RepID=UPI003CEFC521
MHQWGLWTSGAVGVLALAAAAPASAQAPQSARNYEIPAGSLRDVLNAFAAASDQQLFFESRLVDGKTSPGLSGAYTSAQALSRLLDGAGLQWSEPRPGVIYIRTIPAVSLSAAPAAELEEVVVTGSLLRDPGPAVSPVVTLGRDELDRRGRATVAEVLVELPQNYAGSSTPLVQGAGSDRSGSNSVYATGVNLRGLGPSSTLSLVNGRRLAGSGFRGEFADVSALPSAAVERVDVLLDGASAIYGTDAVAGVVNVILRRTYDGQESRVRASAAQGGAEDIVVSHLIGRTWSGGGAYLSAEHQTTNAFSTLDRPYTADGDLRPYGGTDRRTLYSSPGNILAFDPAAGGYVSRYAIRPNASGSATSLADFVAGGANRQSLEQGGDIAPAIERYSAYARWSQTIGGQLDLSADLRFSQRDYTLLRGASAGIFNVSAANPHFLSPVGASSHLIGYSFLNDVGLARAAGQSRSVGGTIAARYDFTSGWSLDAYAALATERGEVGQRNRVNSRFVNEALGALADDPATSYSAARDGYLNLFGAGEANSEAVLAFISQGYSGGWDRSRAGSVNLLAEGPLWSMPGGEARLAVGAQWRSDHFDTEATSFLSSAAPIVYETPERSREIAAVFAEARFPLVGEGNARPGLRRLDLSVAGRLERYDDFGETANPRLGLAWGPVDDLLLRATWGTSFRAPSLPQIYDAAAVNGLFLSRPGGAQVLSLMLVGGNADLEPETAETFTAGFSWRPRGRLHLDVSYFDTRFTNRIAQPVAANPAGALSDPALAPFVTAIAPAANPADLARVQGLTGLPGFPSLYPLTTYGAIVDARWVNTGAVKIRGVDLEARYPIALAGGALTLEGTGSWVLEYDNRPTPASAVQDVIGLTGYPARLRARIGASWTHGAIGGGLHWSHSAAGRDRLGARVGAWDTLDGRVSWTPGTGSGQGLRLALTIQNLLDADPPFFDSANGYGFDPGQGNPYGRVVALQLIKRW